MQIAISRPRPLNSQPTPCPGRRDTISAPTVANASPSISHAAPLIPPKKFSGIRRPGPSTTKTAAAAATATVSPHRNATAGRTLARTT